MQAQTVKMTNAEVVASCLKRHGVEYIFGQSNPSKIMLACEDIGIRQIGYRQENTGSYMAQAYGMATHKVPVIAAQNGPAATLLVPGLAECLAASHPMVAILQQVGLSDYDKNAFQELDHHKLFEGCTKWCKTVMHKDRIEDYIDMAFAVAAGGRPGPVVLLFPVDIFNDDTKYERTLYRSVQLGTSPLDRTVADPAAVTAAAEMLMNAENPIIYAGGGVKSAGAQAEIRAIQEKYSIPVMTTLMGKGSVDETHPLTIGVTGYITAQRGMAKFMRPMIDSADTVLLVGNRTNQNGTDSWTLLPKGANYIHIDVDSVEIGRNYEANVRLLGDAKLTLAALDAEMARLDGAKRAAARAGLETQIKLGREAHIREIADVTVHANSAPIMPEKLMEAVERHLDPDHILVADASFSSIWIANYITAKDEREFYLPRGLAGLGWGLPMAMGAKLGKPNRKVFCLSGDGGFAHAWSELECCKREGIDVVCVVLNNEMLGYQYHAEHAKFGNHTTASCNLYPVDYAKLAEACGLKGMTVRDPKDLDKVLEEAFHSEGTVIIDMITDDRSVPPVNALKSQIPQF